MGCGASGLRPFAEAFELQEVVGKGRFGEGGRLFEEVGSWQYRSPEMHSKAGYTEKTDVWSFGVMAYALLFNEFPYAPQDRIRTLILQNAEPYFVQVPAGEKVGESLGPAARFCRVLLRRNQDIRCSATEALQLGFITGLAASVEMESDCTAICDPHRTHQDQHFVKPDLAPVVGWDAESGVEAYFSEFTVDLTRNKLAPLPLMGGEIEDLSTLTSVTFDLELLIGEASKYGIRRCRLALLRNTHVLTEEWFDVSSKVPLRFYISSSCFDKSSAYTVAVLWLRPTEPAPRESRWLVAQRGVDDPLRGSVDGQGAMFAPPGRRPPPSSGRSSGLKTSLGEKDLSPRSPREESRSCAARARRDDRPMTVHEANRAKKAIERNRKAIENRIRYFQKEEEKIWRDLEEVRRQAATIEEGRSRTIEKKLADRAIQQEIGLVKASQNRVSVSDYRKRQQFESMREKQLAAQAQRETSQAILHQKRQLDLEMRKANSERAAMIQIAQKEARSRASQGRSLRLERMREFQEYERQQAEQEVLEAEATLPDLEEQEMICLQRLQNSRIVTQSVLEELETRLGTQSSVATLLRSKQRTEDPLDSVGGLSTGLPQEPEAAADAAQPEAGDAAELSGTME
eukprot:g25112.t1